MCPPVVRLRRSNAGVIRWCNVSARCSPVRWAALSRGSLFRWRNVSVGAARVHVDACATRCSPEEEDDVCTPPGLAANTRDGDTAHRTCQAAFFSCVPFVARTHTPYTKGLTQCSLSHTQTHNAHTRTHAQARARTQPHLTHMPQGAGGSDLVAKHLVSLANSSND